LTEELCEESKPIDTRRLAGLILKNELDAKDEARKNTLVQKWVELNLELKANIKGRLILALGSTVTDVGKVCAQVVAKIASIEIPRQLWPDLIQTLLQNMGLAQHPNLNSLRLCTLETLGYICEELAELKESVMEQEVVNNILTAIVQGMRKEEPSADVRYAATCALLNAVDCASVNFENDGEQKYIMQMVFEGTQSPDVRTRRASFECIVAISAAYYHKLLPYMSDLYQVSCKAIQSDEEAVALQSIEVWCTIAEEEMDLLDDEAEAQSCHNFIKNAAPHLIPVLLETLTKQEEELQEDGTCDIAMAWGT
jgi:importin subunit beta-1